MMSERYRLSYAASVLFARQDERVVGRNFSLHNAGDLGKPRLRVSELPCAHCIEASADARRREQRIHDCWLSNRSGRRNNAWITYSISAIN